jgi:hypothetical protein
MPGGQSSSGNGVGIHGDAVENQFFEIEFCPGIVNVDAHDVTVGSRVDRDPRRYFLALRKGFSR